jgi:IS5 family transposase
VRSRHRFERARTNEARWTRKHGKSHYGYKNHVSVDRRHKLVRRYQVTDAAVHDSQVVDDILDPDNTASDVWADSAYRSAEIEAKLEEKGLKSRIHRKGHRNKPLSERSLRGNKTRSKVRVRVEGETDPPGSRRTPKNPRVTPRETCYTPSTMPNGPFFEAPLRSLMTKHRGLYES